ncbi:glycosyl hydrolase [Clostridium beijerinckii]|uniref:Glycosyl hydrolase n=1 Tax=Clostridium beijerinckii TaxID=1520 RepID=A0A0B5QRA7_CLOBE|nr:glycoside hydrolase family 3 C-terminal domain-containing protein [Clostridium beijerinckii]AJH00797.1 glycosyl hydrolase [Clostridium beijerinckii]
MKCTKLKRLSYTEKAKEIVNPLTLEEKVSLMGGNVTLNDMLSDLRDADEQKHYNSYPYPAGGIEKNNVPPMLFCDGPRGVVCSAGKSTCFPVSMLRGATFDTALEEKIGNAIGKEVHGYKGNLFAGVCINLPYNPGWGRSQETYGEESFHLGEMGRALVKGVQDENVIACVKHFAFNQMEISRFKVNVECDKRTEREVFLPHFKKCVEAGAAAIMSSYNLYKGTHCGHHDYLLNQVLKKEWDFDGFVMSDFIWGVRDTAEAANGGQDMEMCCTQFFGDKLVEAVKNGQVKESKIDESALRIVRTLLAFEDAYSNEYDESVIGCEDHIKLALQAAREGITLIKNENNILPLNKDKAKKIVVLGKLGDKEVIGDHGSSQVRPAYVITPLQGIANAAPKAQVVYYNGENLEHAKELAKDADAVIFVVGYNYDDEGEYISEDEFESYTGAVGGDRKNSLGLHENEIKLIQEVGPVNTNSIAVLIGGNMIMMEEWKESVGAIMMAYYPGMEGGTAIGEIIFGDVNPSGKLPYVIPFRESDLPQVNWDTTSQWYDYYHGYTKLEKEGIKPSAPYGYGLSYTKFDFSDAKFAASDDSVIAKCTVKNIGKMAGDEVVQMYVGFKNSSVERPVKLLRGFARVNLQPGESKEVTITCPKEELCWYNPKTEQMELEKMEYEVYVGSSSADSDLHMGKVTL